MRKTYIISTALLALVFGGCTKWLDVEADDKILEKKAFSSESGIDNVLNGLYRTMAGNDLYGNNLTGGTVDFLAHFYDFPNSDAALVGKSSLTAIKLLGLYSYDSAPNNTTREDYLTPIWRNGYKFVLGCNTFIKNMETTVDETILPAERRDLYLGEAYGLRAMMHLDLYRLFGPQTPDGEAGVLPYHTNAVIEIPDYVAPKQFLANVMADLDKATELLKETDPAIVDTLVYDHHDDDNNLLREERFAKNYRNKRMNYWAVQVLKMRVHMLLGTDADLNEVVTLAEDLLTNAVDATYVDADYTNMRKKAKAFAWTPSGESVGDNLIYYDEVIFGTSKTDLSSWWLNHFGMTSATADTRAVVLANLRDNLFFQGAQDTRKDQWKPLAINGATIGTLDQTYFASEKYSGKTLNNTTDEKNIDFKIMNMISLIRLSEVQYMLAEAQLKLGALPDAITAVNRVLALRGLQENTGAYSEVMQLPDAATEANILNTLRLEYYREFVYEGQAWHFLKRNDLVPVSGGAQGNAAGFTAAKYVLPRPDTETDYYDDKSEGEE